MRKRLMYSLILALSDDEYYFKHVTSSEEDVLFVTLHRVFEQGFIEIITMKYLIYDDERTIYMKSIIIILLKFNKPRINLTIKR